MSAIRHVHVHIGQASCWPACDAHLVLVRPLQQQTIEIVETLVAIRDVTRRRRQQVADGVGGETDASSTIKSESRKMGRRRQRLAGFSTIRLPVRFWDFPPLPQEITAPISFISPNIFCPET